MLITMAGQSDEAMPALFVLEVILQLTDEFISELVNKIHSGYE